MLTRNMILTGLAALFALLFSLAPAVAGSTVVADATTRIQVQATDAENSVATATAGNIVFILDASGSMWGQVEGQAKIAIAKEVLTGLVTELPDDAVVGLVAYGHRRKGDCDDVEELIPLGPLDKEKMIAKIQALSPKGKTPISRSVRLTAERIKHLEDETTIILVSDGKETCDPDPCGLVKDLKAAGIQFVMHVIGFDVTEEEREQLECMAREGGGQYYTAGNAGEFLSAAREVVQKATPPYGILEVTATKNGKPFRTFVTLTDPASGKRWTKDSTSGETERWRFDWNPAPIRPSLRTRVSAEARPRRCVLKTLLSWPAKRWSARLIFRTAPFLSPPCSTASLSVGAFSIITKVRKSTSTTKIPILPRGS